MSTKITSRVILNAGSLGRLPTKEGGTLHFGGIKREPVIGDDGVLGFTERYESALGIKVMIAHAAATDEKSHSRFCG